MSASRLSGAADGALRCRSCGASGVAVAFSLGDQPLANALAPTEEQALLAERYPLEVGFCPSCSLAQLTVSVPPERLFSDYAYFSSYSPTVVGSARDLVHRLAAERGLGADDLVVEVASNDGYLLEHYQQRGVRVLGVDPARNVAEAAQSRGVPTRCAFFGRQTAAALRDEGDMASVIHAHNVLAHVPDPNEIVGGIAALLAPDGVAVLEFPYLRDLVDHVEFDTIYHEHMSYFSVTALTPLFARNGLALLDIERIDLHGGSLRVFAGHALGADPKPSVEALLEQERDLGMDRAGYLEQFGSRVGGLCKELVGLLERLRSEGASVVGYGAAAKATVLLNALGVGRELVGFVADHSPHKQDRFIPGVGIPTSSPEAMIAASPDVVLVFAWNFADEILRQYDALRQRGTRFVIPIPELRVV